MKLEYFQKIIDYFDHDYKKISEGGIEINQKEKEKVLKLFDLELNFNLLEVGGIDRKKEVLEFYIHKFSEVQKWNFSDNYGDLEYFYVAFDVYQKEIIENKNFNPLSNSEWYMYEILTIIRDVDILFEKVNDYYKIGHQKPKEFFDISKGYNFQQYDELFGNNIEGKNKVWRYMIDLKMIDTDCNLLCKNSFIRSFVEVMVETHHIPANNITTLTRIFCMKLKNENPRINNSIDDEKKIIKTYLKLI